MAAAGSRSPEGLAFVAGLTDGTNEKEPLLTHSAVLRSRTPPRFVRNDGETVVSVNPVGNAAEAPDVAQTPRGLVWTGVTLTVSSGGSRKSILTDCSGSCYPGQVACIIGPSGAGKTSLFNALCGIVSRGISPGSSITLDGQRLTRELARTEVAYVTQEDSMLTTVTPREAMTFSARLRLPASTSPETITQLVDGMLVRLGLQSCADTMIGDELKRGISGGEKKRTAIGVELITQPTTLFLDEPTSGLDSFAALEIVKLLRQLADEGCTVLSVVHQPSSEIFDAFDRVILMAKGQIMYGGAAKAMLDHFSAMDYVCPLRYNPADYVLFLMQTEAPEALAKIRSAWETSPAFKETGLPPQAKVSTGNPRISWKGPRPGFGTQLMALVTRESQGVIRNKHALVARFGISGFMNLFFSLIFYQVGTASTNCPGFECTPSIQDHFGAVCNVAIGLMFGAAQPTLLAFPLERPTFLREYGTATYGTLPYFLSKTIVEMVLTFTQSALIFGVVYYIMDLRGDILYLILAGFGLSLVANSLALALGCGISSVKVALEVSPLIFVPQILFSGVFIKIQSIPVFLRWVQYLCSLKWALNIMMITEFSEEACKPPSKYLDGPWAGNTTAEWQEACDVFLDRQDVSRDRWHLYVGVLAGIFFVARTLAAIFLQAKAV